MRSRHLSSQSPSVDRFVGRALRELRHERGLTADAVATEMRALGYEAWTSSVVAALENGRRRIGIEELVGLASALGVAVARLLDAPAVALTGSRSVSGRELARMLCADTPNLEQPRVNRLLEEVQAPSDRWAIEANGDFEQQLALRVGVPAVALTAISFALWEGRSPTEERNRRAIAPEARQWAAREIREELEELLDRGTLRDALEILGEASSRLLLVQPFWFFQGTPIGEELTDARVWAIVAVLAEKARMPAVVTRVVISDHTPKVLCDALISRGVEVKTLGDLHAKFLVGDERALKTSAPFSDPGLSESSEQVLAVSPDAVSEIVDQFELLWRLGTDVSLAQSYS